jgi:Tfp pilus assembly protein PilX
MTLQEQLAALAEKHGIDGEFVVALGEMVQSHVDTETNTLKEAHQTEVETLKADHKVALEEAEAGLAQKEAELVEQMGSYADSVVEEFLDENEDLIAMGEKWQQFEPVLAELAAVLAENLADPQDQIELEQLRAKLTESEQKVATLQAESTEHKRGKVFDELTEGLTDVQKDKFRVIAEKAETLESFTSMVQSLVESVSTAKPTETGKPLNENTDGDKTTHKTAGAKWGSLI